MGTWGERLIRERERERGGCGLVAGGFLREGEKQLGREIIEGISLIGHKALGERVKRE